MSLQEKIDEIVRESAKKFPPEAFETLTSFRSEIDRLVRKEDIPGKGDLFPSFELLNQEERSVSSEDYLARGPLVATFFRGKW
ncbi:MAG: hypothetical protein JW971_10365 [Synergistales bacterium]|nr:hypothetical protein [Synergistales bacterium]